MKIYLLCCLQSIAAQKDNLSGIHISFPGSQHPTLIPDTMLIAGDIDLPQSTISVSIGYFYEAPRDGPPTVLPICRGDELSRPRF